MKEVFREMNSSNEYHNCCVCAMDICWMIVQNMKFLLRSVEVSSVNVFPLVNQTQECRFNFKVTIVVDRCFKLPKASTLLIIMKN